MKSLLLLFLTVMFVLAMAAWVRYGGGEPYPDLTTSPLLNADELEEVLSHPLPIGNVAVSGTGRVFFTVHPEARPEGNKLLEFVDGSAVPYPGVLQQAALFDTVLGIAIDRRGNLWTIDHGNHGTRSARLLAFDLVSGEVIHDHRLPSDIAPPGSFLQDLQISEDGRTVIVADASFWRKSPAIIVYDVESETARRVLESHPSVSAEKFVIAHDGKPMRFFGGLVALRGGVEHNAVFAVGEDREPQTLLRSPRIRWPDALSFGPDGWLYVADSALQEVVLKPQGHVRASGPYRIFRFRPGAEGVPGQ
jgi:hypothetical protein